MDTPHLIKIEATIFNVAQITQVEVAHTEVGHNELVTIYFTDGKSKSFRNKFATAALAALAPMISETKIE